MFRNFYMDIIKTLLRCVTKDENMFLSHRLRLITIIKD